MGRVVRQGVGLPCAQPARHSRLDRRLLHRQSRLVIEVDGDVHDLQVEQDARRTLALEAEGLRVIRVRNEAVLANLPQVLARIVDAVTAG